MKGLSVGFGVAALTVIGLACGDGNAPTPKETVAAPQQSDYSITDLKYRLIEHFGGVLVGDPAIFPDEYRREQARVAFPTIQQNEEEFQAILDQLGLERGSELTVEQQVLVWEEKKKLKALSLEPSENGYSFWMMVREAGDPYEISGVVEQTGEITVLTKEHGRVPVCLAGSTRIDTPAGSLLVTDLAVGMDIWTVDASGARVNSVIERVGSSPAPVGHQMVHLVLDDGRQLLASPGHPLADGRRLEELVPGDVVDGAWVTFIENVDYEGTDTYDVLPAGATGQYSADGVLLGSTLFVRPNCGK